jgi:AmmeMemoRadiSam system protein A
MHPIIELAKKSVEAYVKEGRTIEPPDPLLPEMSGKAGVFVCVKKKRELRGCIGTFLPACGSIAAEIVANAISAASRDPRFYPIREDELKELEYSVDVLSCPEKIKDLGELDPRKYGIIVVSADKRGLLLPDLEGVDTVAEQLKITKMKADIPPDEDVEIYRFEVKRYK